MIREVGDRVRTWPTYAAEAGVAGAQIAQINRNLRLDLSR